MNDRGLLFGILALEDLFRFYGHDMNVSPRRIKGFGIAKNQQHVRLKVIGMLMDPGLKLVLYETPGEKLQVAGFAEAWDWR